MALTIDQLANVTKLANNTIRDASKLHSLMLESGMDFHVVHQSLEMLVAKRGVDIETIMHPNEDLIDIEFDGPDETVSIPILNDHGRLVVNERTNGKVDSGDFGRTNFGQY
jgi:hypothetical protein